MLSVFPAVLHFSSEDEAVRFRESIRKFVDLSPYRTYLRVYDICVLAKNSYDSNFLNACTNSAYQDLSAVGWDKKELDQIKIYTQGRMAGAILMMPPVHAIDITSGRFKWGNTDE